MRKTLLLLPVLCATFTQAQRGFGFGAGMATSKAPMVFVKYFVDKNAASIGLSYQVFNNALGKNMKLIPGTFAIGDGKYFYTVDVGYTRVLSEKFNLSGEVSIGQRKRYQNLSDPNFSEGGYHRILDTKTIGGGGVLLTYNINNVAGVFGGYNSIRQATLGIEVKFLK